MPGRTRAELLAECRELGLRATGWKKERMEEELARLAGSGTPEAPVAPPDDVEWAEAALPLGVEAMELAGASEPADEPAQPPPSRLSGWCSRAPAWGRAHLACRERVADGRLPTGCSCGCHEPGWERPAIPDGAELSKFNREDREARGEEAPDAPDPEGRLRELAARAAAMEG